MPSTRTITEQDLDAETRKFVQELAETAHDDDAAVETDSMDVGYDSTIDGRFGE